MVLFKGGLDYTALMSMPLPELLEWVDVANRISKEDERELNKKR